MKKSTFLLMTLLILSLSGCQRVVYQTKEVPVFPPEGLIYEVCDYTLGFTTPRELAINNRKNLGCIKDYKTMVDNYLVWKEKQEEVFSITPNNNRKEK